jgi:hypothetical protein
MALRMAVGAVAVRPMRRAFERGERAIFGALAIALTVTAGAGLVLTSALLALSAWIGSIAATGWVGLILLLAAGISLLAQRNRKHPRADRSGIGSADLPRSGPTLLLGLAIALGVALGTRLRRKRP